MPIIPRTVLGTSDPAKIQEGFALWPALGQSRVAVSTGGSNFQLVNVPQTQVLTFRLVFSTASKLFIGVAGPGYGIRLDASGSSAGSTLTLNIANDVVVAGLLYGINFGVSMNCVTEVLVPQWVEDGWNSRFIDTWQPLLNLSLDFNIDVIDLIAHLIVGKVVQRNNANTKYNAEKSSTNIDGVIGVFNIFGATDPGTMAAQSGVCTVAPTFLLPVNLVSFLKLIPKIGAFLVAIENVIQLSLGITLNFGFPVDISIVRMSLDASQYQNLTWNGAAVTGVTNGTGPDNPQRVGMAFQHSLSTRLNEDFELSVGLFMSLTFIKVLSVGITTPTVQIPNLLGQQPTRQSFVNAVSNNIGQPLGLEDEEIEVVFV